MIKKFSQFIKEDLNPRDLRTVLGDSEQQKKAREIYEEFLKSGDTMEKLDELKVMYPKWYNRANDDSNNYIDAVMAMIKASVEVDDTIVSHIEDVILGEMEEAEYAAYKLNGGE